MRAGAEDVEEEDEDEDEDAEAEAPCGPDAHADCYGRAAKGARAERKPSVVESSPSHRERKPIVSRGF